MDISTGRSPGICRVMQKNGGCKGNWRGSRLASSEPCDSDACPVKKGMRDDTEDGRQAPRKGA